MYGFTVTLDWGRGPVVYVTQARWASEAISKVELACERMSNEEGDKWDPPPAARAERIGLFV